LLERTGPLASTSANRSGEPPISAPENLAPELQMRLGSTVNTGLCVGEPSALVDFTGDEPRVIRDTHNFFTQNLWKTQRKSL
jgi:L-threonylcarbamoyladenylate synthase